MGIISFTQLDVWKKAHQAVLDIYRFTRDFPQDERYGLSSQRGQASVSIPANIAEGFGRQKPQDKARFYNISQGPAEELRYYPIPAKDPRFLKNGSATQQALDEVSRMLRRLTQATLRDS
jgi:four helix bundle protein